METAKRVLHHSARALFLVFLVCKSVGWTNYVVGSSHYIIL